MNKQYVLSALTVIGILVGCSAPKVEKITINQPNVFPEGITYNKKDKSFYISSLKYGQIGAVNTEGAYDVIINEPELISTIGLDIDQKNKLLLVCNSDPGVSIKSTPETQKKIAGLAIYSLKDKKRQHYVALEELYPGAHFANDVTTDGNGTAYVTDSFSPVIYQVNTKTGEASLFLAHDRFMGKGFNLNGVVYHPDGYLIVAKFNEGVFFKIPIDSPGKNMKQIDVGEPLIGADGLVLLDENRVLVVQNAIAEGGKDQVHILETSDEWVTATIQTQPTKKEYDKPTTAVKVGRKSVFVLNTFLNKVFAGQTHNIFHILKVQL